MLAGPDRTSPAHPHRSRYTRLAGTVLLAWGLVAGCSKAPSRFPGAPVILISVDTLRADHLPAYGYTGVETPQLDRFRRDAILFENAYSHVPLTLPSHASLLTGLTPPEHGVRDNIGYRLDTTAHVTLPQLLKARGYATGAAVSAYVLRHQAGLGPAFDFYQDAIETYGDLTLDRQERRGEETIALAQQWLAEQGERPFFLLLHLFEPHDPYEPPEPLRSRYAERPYDGEIAHVDELLGGFFDELRQRGLYDKALILFLSDHGEGLGDHGESKHGLLLYRPTLHVPLMVKLPGSVRGGETVHRVAQLLDVLPTVTAAVGAETPAGLKGTSLLSLKDDPAGTAPPRRVYSETYYGRLHYGWSELRSITDDQYQYIESPRPELFDIVADPREEHNLLADQRRVYHELRTELEQYPRELAGPAAADPEEAARLAALGYLTASAPESSGPRPDPKDNLHVLDDVQRAVDLRTAGRYEEAVALLRDLIARYPLLQDAHLLLAPALRALGRYDEALAAAEEARRQLPTLGPLISLELARIHLLKGDLDQAEVEAKAGAESNRAQSLELLTRIALVRNDLDAAADYGRQAREEGAVPRVSALLLGAKVALLKEQPEAALELLDQARQRVQAGKHPPTAGLESDRGDALARLGRYPQAEEAFREEIRRFPEDLQAYSRLAILLAATHRFDEIEPLLEQMATANPQRRSYLVAAETLERLGNREGAGRWRQRARTVPAS